MAREKDERGSASNKSKRDFKSKKSGNIQKEDVEIIKNQLMALGLTLREVPGDGNCLFRALGDQLDGHMANHFRHRHDTTNYMREHRDDFRPFVEDDVPFEKYISTLVQPGTYAGNDAIVAFARNHQVTVVIHQPNAPLWQIKGWEVESVSNNVATKKKNKLHIHRHPQLHIAYHGGDHYDSVRRIGDSNHTPANIWIEVDNNCKEAINEDQGCVFQEICDVGELEETSEIEREAMARSGCSDLLTVRQLLYNNCGNIEAAVEDLIALSNSSLATSASEEKTHSTASSANRKKSSRKSLKVRKQERKRASEERKKCTASVNSPLPDDVLVIHKVQCLNI